MWGFLCVLQCMQTTSYTGRQMHIGSAVIPQGQTVFQLCETMRKRWDVTIAKQ